MTERHSGEQVLLIDAGNTNTVFGVLRGGRLGDRFRLSTRSDRTADEYAALLLPLLARAGVDAGATRAVVVSSVVPPLAAVLVRLARSYFGSEARFVGQGLATGMAVRTDHPAEVGADRIVNSVAARELYGAPVVVVDFGTATTFDVVDGAGDYCGGLIAPGIGISAEALFARASRLYRTDVRRPERLIGRDTSGAMQSGLYYGYVGLVDGILRRLHDELPGLRTVVATGGQAALIAGGSEHIQEVNEELTLVGLQRIYERNRDRG